MIIFFSYLLKVGACIIAFYLVYMSLLSKETFFKLSRFVLILLVIFSIALPIWTITITKEIATTQVVQQNMEASSFAGQMLTNPDSNDNNWTDIFPIIGLGVYILGALIFFTRNIYGILQIYRIMKHSRREVTADVKLFIVRKAIIPFSWFNNIIISEEDYTKNRDIIIEHEKAHMKLKHGYDLLFINLIAIFQWFNPVIWLLRKELISVHEYQADNWVINKGIDAKKYQYLLISKGTAQCFSIPVVNHLCSGNFKKRIKMMLKKQSNPQNAIKVLLLIPLMAGAIVAFAKTEYVVSDTSEDNITKYDNNSGIRINNGEEAKNIFNDQAIQKPIKDDLKTNKLNIKINDDGTFLVNGEKIINISDLRSAIKSQFEKLKSPSKESKFVIVHSSSNTPKEVIEKIIEILKEEKITKIYFATKQSSKIDLFSKSSESTIVRFVSENVIYPQDAKNSCDTGRFYITVKIDKGQIIESKFHTSKAGIKVPILNEIVIVGYKPYANDVPEMKVDNEYIALKNESLRIANKLTELRIPEWKDKCVEFALLLNFSLK